MHTKQIEEKILNQQHLPVFSLPLISVDTVMFTYYQQQLKVLVVKHLQDSGKIKWGILGGGIELQQDHDLKAAAQRHIQSKTTIAPAYLEQLYTQGNDTRDARGWSITVCYLGLIAYQDCIYHLDQHEDAMWVDLPTIEQLDLLHDHRQLIADARERLRRKALYSIVPAYVLPEYFTLPELQQVHECLLAKTIQKKSFRRRIELADLLEDSGKKRSEGYGRPASLYCLKPQARTYTFVRNLEE